MNAKSRQRMPTPKFKRWMVMFDSLTGPMEGHAIKERKFPYTPIAFLWIGGGTKGKPKQRANARLIAAAPELLKALVDLRDMVKVLGIEFPKEFAKKVNRTMGAADRAIGKAVAP